MDGGQQAEADHRVAWDLPMSGPLLGARPNQARPDQSPASGTHCSQCEAGRQSVFPLSQNLHAQKTDTEETDRLVVVGCG